MKFTTIKLLSGLPLCAVGIATPIVFQQSINNNVQLPTVVSLTTVFNSATLDMGTITTTPTANQVNAFLTSKIQDPKYYPVINDITMTALTTSPITIGVKSGTLEYNDTIDVTFTIGYTHSLSADLITSTVDLSGPTSQYDYANLPTVSNYLKELAKLNSALNINQVTILDATGLNKLQ
jgi:hypothetical protein